VRKASAESRLVAFALHALEEAAAQAHHGEVRRTWGLRLALAYLASRDRSDHTRWAFEQFWRGLGHPRPRERWTVLNAALNGIYRAIGQKRDWQRVSDFEQRSTE